MHHVLHIQEILLNIFSYCRPTEPPWDPDRRHSTACLAALARSCRTFREPALDVLWSELVDLTPLPRCIPKACRVTGRGYAFKREPDQEEWNILRSYARRVRHISFHDYPDEWLDIDSLTAICSQPAVDPLFPNLRSFWLQGTTVIPAVHIAVPSLTSLHLSFMRGHVPDLGDILGTIGACCPNIEQYYISIPRPHDYDEAIRTHIRRQTSLREFYSQGVVLDADTISHLSGIHTLKRLYHDVSDQLHIPGSIFDFSTLEYLEMKARSLEQATELLSCTRLPVIEDLNINFFVRPSKETLGSYMTTVRDSCSSDSLSKIIIRCHTQSLKFFRGFPSISQSNHHPTFDDVRPCMAFTNLCHVHMELPWSVDLNDADLLTLVSSWPRLHTLVVNSEWGWRTTSGITLRGFIQLLRDHRLLSTLCIALRTESHANLPQGFEIGFTSYPSPLAINLADSPIRSEDVPALVDIFVKFGLPADTSFSAWDGINMGDDPGALDYKHTWRRVFNRTVERLKSPPGLIEE